MSFSYLYSYFIQSIFTYVLIYVLASDVGSSIATTAATGDVQQQPANNGPTTMSTVLSNSNNTNSSLRPETSSNNENQSISDNQKIPPNSAANDLNETEQNETLTESPSVNTDSVTGTVHKAISITSKYVSNSSVSSTSPSITSSNVEFSTSESNDAVTSRSSLPYDGKWMDYFLVSHHFLGQYKCDELVYGFDFVVRSVHASDLRTLVTYFHDVDGAMLELNGR